MKVIKMAKVLYILPCILVILSVTGCWDQVELESRGFVISVGIDTFDPSKEQTAKEAGKAAEREEERQTAGEEAESSIMETPMGNDQNKEEERSPAEDRNQKGNKEEEKASEQATAISFEDGTPLDNRFAVTMALPNLGAIVGSGGDDKTKAIKIANDKTIAGAISIVDTYSSQKLYFGHTKNCIFGEEVLQDSTLFKEALDSLERNRDISRTLIVLGTSDRAQDILQTDVIGEPLVGMFIANFYKNNANTAAATFRMDLERLIGDLRATGNAVLPRIETVGSEVKLSGAGIIKDYALAGWMNDKQTRGYLWYFGKANGAEIIVDYNNIPVPLYINEQKSNITFAEENGRLLAFVQIQADGSVEEYTLINNYTMYQKETMDELEKRYEQFIANELLATENLFQKEYEVDGFGILNSLRKQNYDLYLKYKEHWDEAIANLEMIPIVDVTIRNIGSIK